jgi:hypothetical protein
MKRYHVSGSMPIFGNQPGTEFELEIPLEQEARLLAAGALRVIDAATSPASSSGGKATTKTRRRTGRTAARPATTTTDAHGTATGAGADRED